MEIYENKELAYGLSSVDELLSAGFSLPQMQEILEGIPLENPQGRLKTLWDSFVNIVRQTLGLPQSQWNALSELLTTGLEISQATPQERGFSDKELKSLDKQTPEQREKDILDTVVQQKNTLKESDTFKVR